MTRPLVVLLVENHADTREMYADALRAAGFEVLQAADDAKALAVTTNSM